MAPAATTSTNTAKINLRSPNVSYSEDFINSKYEYSRSRVVRDGDSIHVEPVTEVLDLRLKSRVAKTGVMLVGLGGNNGSTFVAGVLANRNKLSWRTRSGLQRANWFGSWTQCASISIGHDSSTNEDCWVAQKDVIPLADPSEFAVFGWDISGDNLYEAMEKAQVCEPTLRDALRSRMEGIVPLPGIYRENYIAANQQERANNTIAGDSQDCVDQVRRDIQNFKVENEVDTVIVLWTANTESMSDYVDGIHDTSQNLLKAIKSNDQCLAPSILYATACALEGVAFINGSPQNTLCPGIVELAAENKTFIAGDDFKTGQTKMKSVLTDFLISSGFKLRSIVSYNHLGNNDGKNLSSDAQFRSKEISKSNVVDDLIASNPILYKENEKPDHCVVIKYVPAVGDSKRAMDEYTSEIFCGGINTIVMHNTCEDSLLAVPLMADLIVLTEFCMRLQLKKGDESEYKNMDTVLSLLSLLTKAPKVQDSEPVINAFFSQRDAIQNIFRAILGLPPANHMRLLGRF